MFRYTLINVYDGQVVTTGESFTRRFAIYALASFVIQVVPYHWHVILEYTQYGFDIIRLDHSRKVVRRVTVYRGLVKENRESQDVGLAQTDQD